MANDKPIATSGTYLKTRYVFVDTSTYMSLRLNWNDPRLTRLRELASKSVIQLLTTDITRRDIERKMQERVEEALKHKTTLEHLGIDVSTLNDPQGAAALGKAACMNYFEQASAFEVPTSASVPKLVQDYFDRTPPFSGKKKEEWRDAIVGSSLLAFARTVSAKGPAAICVVSDDRDFEHYCSVHPELIWGGPLASVLSSATEATEVYALVREHLVQSDALRERIADELSAKPIRVVLDWPHSQMASPGGSVLGARVLEFDEIYVIEHNGLRFECEVLFDAELSVEVEIADADRPLDYRSRKHVTVGERAMVNVEFDPGTGKLDIESIVLDDDIIEVEASNLD